MLNASANTGGGVSDQKNNMHYSLASLRSGFIHALVIALAAVPAMSGAMPFCTDNVNPGLAAVTDRTPPATGADAVAGRYAASGHPGDSADPGAAGVPTTPSENNQGTPSLAAGPSLCEPATTVPKPATLLLFGLGLLALASIRK